MRAGGFGKPCAERHCLVPRHANGRLFRPVDIEAAHPELHGEAGLHAAVMGGIEPRELGIGDFTGAHPKRLINGDHRGGAFIGKAVCLSHDKGPGRYENKVQPDSIAQLHASARLTQALLTFLGLFLRERPIRAIQFRLGRLGQGRGHHGDNRFRRRDGDGFRVGVHGRIPPEQFAAAPCRIFYPLFSGDLGPGAMKGGIEINPGDDAVPGRLIQFHVVMSLAEQLHQFRGVRMEFHGCQQVIVALQSRSAHEAVQLRIGHGEMTRIPAAVVKDARVIGNVGAVFQVGYFAAIGACFAIVAASAMFVQHGLQLAVIVITPVRAEPGGNLRGAPANRDAGVCRRRRILALMASRAGNRFAPHPRKPAAHQLQRLALPVKGLNRNRGIRGHTEISGTVFLHRHDAQNDPHVPRPFHAHHGLGTAHVGIQKMVGKQAQRLDRAPGDIAQPVAPVHIGKIHQGIIPVRVHDVGNHRGYGRLLKGNRFEQGVAGFFPQQEHVVKNIHEINPPQGFRRRLAGDEEVVVTEGIGVQELGP